jgi:hypothetical protein
MRKTDNHIDRAATGELRPERIQEPEAAVGTTLELRPERIQRGEAFQALTRQQNWMFLKSEVIGTDQIVGYFDSPAPQEVSALARIVLEIAPEHGSRPRFSLKAGTASVTFGETDPLSDVDVAFAHLFDVVLPHADNIFAKQI